MSADLKLASAEQFIIRLGRLVTRSRVRAYATIYLVVAVVEYLFTFLTGPGLLDRFGQVKGTDFIQFYVAGQLVAAGRGGELYRFVPPFQFPVQFAAEAVVLNGQLAHPNFGYVVPPFFALLLVPFSRLPYVAALGGWILLNVALLVTALRLLRPHVGLLRGRHRRLVYLVAAGFFPFLECQFDGQNGMISLFFITLAYIALRRERDTLAGLALAAVLFKPQLVVTVALALLLARRWRAILGLIGGGLLLIGVSWLMVGTDGMRDYLALSATMPGWIYLPGWRVWNMHSWQSFFALLFPTPLVSRALTAVFSLATLVAVGWAWWPAPHRQHPTPDTLFPLRFSLAVVGTILVSPHVFAYDLTVLILPGLLLADALTSGELERSGAGPVTRSALRVALALAFLAPLPSRFLAMGLHLQLTVPIIAALFVAATLAIRQGTADQDSVVIAIAVPLPAER